MAYKIFWHTPEQILSLELEGNLSLNHFEEINQEIIAYLEDKDPRQRVTLVIDINRLSQVPQAFSQLKASQTYALRNDLKYILIVGNNKLMRLMMLLTFNLCRPSLMFFDNTELALRFYQKASI